MIALSSYEKSKALIFRISSIENSYIKKQLSTQLKIWKKELNKLEIEYKKNNYKNILLLSNKLRTSIINNIQSNEKIKNNQYIEKIKIEKYEVTSDELYLGEIDLWVMENQYFIFYL